MDCSLDSMNGCCCRALDLGALMRSIAVLDERVVDLRTRNDVVAMRVLQLVADVRLLRDELIAHMASGDAVRAFSRARSLPVASVDDRVARLEELIGVVFGR